jgi:PAS domain S-box-containing protein
MVKIADKEKTLNNEEIQSVLSELRENRKLIDQIKQSKKHYLQVLDIIQDAICVINSDFKIQSCNQAFAEKVGMPVKSVKGAMCFDVFPLFEKNLFKEHCIKKKCGRVCSSESVFITGKKTGYVESSLDGRGVMRHHRISEFPNVDKEGKVSQVVVIIRDVTEQISAEILAKEKIQKMNEELEKKITKRTWQLDKANKELAKVLELQSKFISDASHELRTPLTIIQGNLDLAINEAKIKSEEVPEVLDLLNKEVGQMSSILSDLSMITSADANS